MKSKITAIICLMLAFSFIFASCGKKKYITDKYGETHIAYTDKNGETVTNSNGEAIAVQTDDDGKVVTNARGEQETVPITLSKIKIDASGKNIECSGYTLKVPDGWVITPDKMDIAQLRLGDTQSNVMLEIRYYTGTYEDMVLQAKELIKSFTDNVEEIIVNKEEQVKLKDGEIDPVTRLTFLGASTDKSGEKVTAGLVTYVFHSGTYSYVVICNVYSEDDIKNIDVASVIEAMNFN